MNTQIKHFFVSGTHCSACKHLIEEKLVKSGEFTEVSVSLADETVTFRTVRTEKDDVLAKHITLLLSEYGYGVHTEKPVTGAVKQEWLFATLATFLMLVGFVLLEQAGITALFGVNEVTLSTAFLVGLVASVSTCLAVVGGLVLSVSATYAHEGKGWRPQVYFHTGRIVGFFIFGALLGLLGEVMQLGFYGSAVLGAIASIVMIVLGIHLLDVTRKVRAFTLPSGVANFFTGFVQRTGVFAPSLLGAVTFFLPCGFTQSMQIVSLSSGSAVIGGLTMFLFALGTFPVLALLSFGSLDLAKSRFRGVFFKSAGMLVILFGIFNLHNALVVFGFMNPVISF